MRNRKALSLKDNNKLVCNIASGAVTVHHCFAHKKVDSQTNFSSHDAPSQPVHNNAGHNHTPFALSEKEVIQDYPEHIQQRLNSCGEYRRFMTHAGADIPVAQIGAYKYRCNLNICPKCSDYRTEKAIERYYYEGLSNEKWYKFEQHSPGAQTESDVDALYSELDSTEECLWHNVKYAEIFMVNGRGNKDDRIVSFFVPESEQILDELRKKGTVKRVKKLAKELKKIVEEHVNLYDDANLNGYILRLADEEKDGKAFKKRVRKIGLRGLKSDNSPHRKVPAIDLGIPEKTHEYHAVVGQPGIHETAGTSLSVVYTDINRPGYDVQCDTEPQDGSRWETISFQEFTKRHTEGRNLWEWEQYFPRGTIKKSARCKECKQNCKDLKAAGIWEIFQKVDEELGKDKPICEQTGRHCDFRVRHRQGGSAS